jgi:hypothetical protein
MNMESRRPGEGSGSQMVDPASRPREPNSSDLGVQPFDAISVFAPWCGDDERALRIRIHRARDAATARATRSKHGGARALFWQAAQIASARVFARISEAELRETIDNLARLFLAAGWIERTERPDE